MKTLHGKLVFPRAQKEKISKHALVGSMPRFTFFTLAKILRQPVRYESSIYAPLDEYLNMVFPARYHFVVKPQCMIRPIIGGAEGYEGGDDDGVDNGMDHGMDHSVDGGDEEGGCVDDEEDTTNSDDENTVTKRRMTTAWKCLLAHSGAFIGTPVRCTCCSPLSAYFSFISSLFDRY